MFRVWKMILALFRYSWKILNFTRQFILNVLFFATIALCAGTYFLLYPTVATTTGALLVDLSGVVVDASSSNNALNTLSRSLLDENDTRLRENSLFDLVETLRQARDDKNINGLVLSLDNFMGADFSSLEYIGKALREFRDSGKPIYAVGDNFTQAQYYLASFADKIYLSPGGSIDIHGLSTNTLYYKQLLDNLLISTHVFRVGTYKSAVEPFLRDDMSPEARANNQRWLGILWENYLNVVSSNRQITLTQLDPTPNELLNALTANGGDRALYAQQSKLVDELASRADVEKMLTSTFGWNSQEQDYQHISIYDYVPSKAPASMSDTAAQSSHKIAVLFANGVISDGKHTEGVVGGESLATDIRRARLDPNVKAVVLRINSPGGSVTASELIRDELVALTQAKKPLVISMGGMAASGGYWIATPADYIVASSSTITGSIGIFGVITTFEKSLEHIGVHTDGVSTSPMADLSLTKDLTPEFKKLMQLGIENGYARFLAIVAESREKSVVEIDKLAQGRVWIGSDAKQNGLIDQIGDFDDAVDHAAHLANITNDYQLDWYVAEPTFTEMLFGQASARIVSALPISARNWLPAPLLEIANTIKHQPGLSSLLVDPQNRYALCMNCANLR